MNLPASWPLSLEEMVRIFCHLQGVVVRIRPHTDGTHQWNPARGAFAQRRRQVEVLAVVVGDMTRPHDPHLVVGTVLPVVEKIVDDHRRDPGERVEPLEAEEDKGEEVWLADIREIATELMMAEIRGDLALLGVQMDVYSSEKALYGTGEIEAAIETLRGMGLIYEGTLEPPKGKEPDDWEPRVQTLFRSTAHGDDVDRPVMKSDGSWTYFAPDIAYHYNKVQRGFDELEQFISNYQPDGSYTDYDITDALFDGTIVAITPFDKNMQVASNGTALRFCLADRTVYLVKNESNWAAITILSK